MTNNPEPVVSTPRTDIAERDFDVWRKTPYGQASKIEPNGWDFARQLETELSASAERIAGLERENKGLIRRLADACSHANTSLLDRAEAAELALSRANAALEAIHEMYDGYCEHHVGISRIAVDMDQRAQEYLYAKPTQEKK